MDAPHRLLVPMLVSIGMLVSFVGGLGAPLLPLLATEYDRTMADAQWALTITLLVGAMVTPTMGRLGDGPHRRTVILGALALVSIGAVLCAVPGGFGLLLVGRGLQGVGLGLMPLAMTVARDHLPTTRSSSAVGLLSVTTAVGAGIGFPIGSFWAQTFGLHVAFGLVAVVSLATLTAAWAILPSSGHREPRSLDWRGSLLLSAPLALLLIGLSRAPTWGSASPTLWLMLLASVAGLALWRRVELRHPAPLVDLRALRIPAVFTAHITALLAGVGMYLLFTLMVSYVQVPAEAGYGMGRSVFTAGLLLVPFSFTSYIANRLRPRLDRLGDRRWAMPFGCATYTGAALLFLLARDSMFTMVLVSAASGLGLGLLLASIPRLIIGSVDRGDIGSALGFNQVLRTIGGAIGSAAVGAVMALHTAPGAVFPSPAGYDWSAVLVAGIWVAMLVMTWRRGTAPRPAADPAPPPGVTDPVPSPPSVPSLPRVASPPPAARGRERSSPDEELPRCGPAIGGRRRVGRTTHATPTSGAEVGRSA